MLPKCRSGFGFDSIGGCSPLASQVSAPVSTTVIACDISGAESFEARVLESFAKVLAAARGLGFVTQEPGKPNLCLTLAPELAVGEVLGQFAKTAATFDADVAPLRLRCVVHFGVVFRTESVGDVSYVGSAIRSTQSALRRAPAAGGLIATQDFVAYSAKLLNPPFRVQAMGDGLAFQGMSQIVFGGRSVAPQRGGGDLPASADPAFVEFVKRRLAEDVGPFASALVDRAIRATAATDQLVAALGRDIDNASARARFEADVQKFINSRSGAR
jgi:hypothetical protein